MDLHFHRSATELGQACATQAAKVINSAIAEKGRADIVLATGASQFDMLSFLTKADVDWSKVRAFHLDEYLGLAPAHPASFRGYLKERFLDQIGQVGGFVAIEGDSNDLATHIQHLNSLISAVSIDVCFAGIGENCHLAFNDPPADLETSEPFIVVDLDADCRAQQHREGWFCSMDDVPTKAISMSIKQVLKSQKVMICVDGERKARAVQQALEGEITPNHPASVLQNHPNTSIHLDMAAATQLSKPTILSKSSI